MRTVNISIFSMKILKLFWENASWKRNFLCIWLKTKIARKIVLLRNFRVKNSLATWLTKLSLLNLIKKAFKYLFLVFLKETYNNHFNSLDPLVSLNNLFDKTFIFHFSLSDILLLTSIKSRNNDNNLNNVIPFH